MGPQTSLPQAFIKYLTADIASLPVAPSCLESSGKDRWVLKKVQCQDKHIEDKIENNVKIAQRKVPNGS